MVVSFGDNIGRYLGYRRSLLCLQEYYSQISIQNLFNFGCMGIAKGYGWCSRVGFSLNLDFKKEKNVIIFLGKSLMQNSSP